MKKKLFINVIFILIIFLFSNVFCLANQHDFVEYKNIEYTISHNVNDIYKISKDSYGFVIFKFDDNSIEWAKRIFTSPNNVIKDLNIAKDNSLNIIIQDSVDTFYSNHPQVCVIISPTGDVKYSHLINTKDLSVFGLYVLSDIYLPTEHYMLLIDDSYTRTFFSLKHPVYLAKIEEVTPQHYKINLLDTIFCVSNSKKHLLYSLPDKKIKIEIKDSYAYIKFPISLKNEIILNSGEIKYSGLHDNILHKYYSITNRLFLNKTQKKIKNYIKFEFVNI